MIFIRSKCQILTSVSTASDTVRNDYCQNMPRELKQRGRRAEKQRKEIEALDSRPAKRRKTTDAEDDRDFTVSGNAGDDFISFGQDQTETRAEKDETETTFYGLLTEEEMEYYANVNNKITANDFESNEDRSMFIEAVYRESAGKEIKVASSQSCSRYLEKVIQLSSASQLKSLFQAFLQDLSYLVQHRFGSHCCETLFLEAAKHVDPKPKSYQRGSIARRSVPGSNRCLET